MRCHWIVAGMLVLATTALAAPPTTKPAARPTGAAKSAEDGLSARLEDIDFKGLTIKQALAAIEEKAGFAIDAHWPELEKTNPVAAATLRGRLMDVTVKQAIQYVLSEARLNEPLEIELAKEKVLVTTVADPALVEPRVYDVQRVLDRLARETATLQPDNTGPAELKQIVIDQLFKTIEQNVAPDSWRDAGGTLGTISLTGTRLTITNTRPAHRKIEALLRDLDKPKGK